MLYMIACVGKNNEIGYDNKLLWSIPEDMARFKQITMRDTLIMGRKTYDSIGKPLEGRTNVVISKSLISHPNPKLAVMCDIERTILWAIGESSLYHVGVIGGAEIYKAFLPFIDKIFLTKVNITPTNVDTYFPINLDEDGRWVKRLESIQSVSLTDGTEADISYITYNRRKHIKEIPNG